MPKPLWGKSKTSYSDTEPASTLPMIPPGEESAYAETAPQPLASVRPASPGDAKQSTLDELMAEIRKDNRVCPQPHKWVEFYKLLQELGDGVAMPPPPLVGQAWAATPSLAKRMCFREQVEWATTHNCMIAAYTFLKFMPQSDWHYMG